MSCSCCWFLLSVILACSILLWHKSPAFKYYAKMIYFIFLTCVVTGFAVIPYALLRPGNVENLRLVAWLWTRLFKVIGLQLDIRDEKRLESDEPYVLISNHQSMLDLIVMMEVLPKRGTFLAKKELLYAGNFGLAAWLCGLVFVDRLNKDQARKTMIETVSLLHQKKLKIWVFPEGTRNSNGNFLPFKKGAFNLAVDAQVPIVPLVVSSYSSIIDHQKKTFESGRVIVQCLDSVPTSGLTSSDVPEMVEQVRERMLKVFEKITAEASSQHSKAS